MLKLTTLFLFVTLFVTSTMNGQTLSKPPLQNEGRTDLKQVFSKETNKLKEESSSVDAKSMEKARRQVQRRNWTSKDTMLVVLVAVGIAALVFVAIKYYKKCIRYENNCSPSFDENCYCAEYEQKENRAQRFQMP